MYSNEMKRVMPRSAWPASNTVCRKIPAASLR